MLTANLLEAKVPGSPEAAKTQEMWDRRSSRDVEGVEMFGVFIDMELITRFMGQATTGFLALLSYMLANLDITTEEGGLLQQVAGKKWVQEALPEVVDVWTRSRGQHPEPWELEQLVHLPHCRVCSKAPATLLCEICSQVAYCSKAGSDEWEVRTAEPGREDRLPPCGV
eukprot:g7039.t1